MTAPGPVGPLPTAVPAGPGGPAGGPDQVPAPPNGPGVVPPFAAPPTEGRTVRLWLGIGSAALGVLLFCGGGAALLVGLAVAGTGALKEQSRAVVDDYFVAVSEGRYDEAYDLLCDDAQRRESLRAFERRMRGEPAIEDFAVGDAEIAEEITVSVDVTYTDGDRETLDVRLAQDSSTGQLEVCGIN